MDLATLSAAADAWAEAPPTDGGALPAGWYPGLAYEAGPTLTRFVESNGRRDLARAPNQVGKSLAGAKRADRWSRANPGGVLGVLVADLVGTYPELCAKIASVITWPDLDPETKYAEGKGFTLHGRYGLRYRNGARWLFRTGRGALQSLEAFSAQAGWVDEVPEQAHYGAFTRGVHGPLWVTMTPIGREVGWFRKRVEGDAETGEPPLEAWTQFVPSLSVAECPWLTPDLIAERIAKTDPYEAPQRLRGEWDGPTGGRRFTAFDGARVINDDQLREMFAASNPYVTMSGDHGEGVGRELWGMILHDQRRIVLADEYVNDHPTRPAEDVSGLMAMLARRRASVANVDRWVADVNSSGKANAGHSVNEDFEAAFALNLGLQSCPFRIEKPSKGAGSVEYGERLLNIAFSAGELFIHERCKRTLKALWGYVDERTTSDLKHPIDMLRYGVQPTLLDRTRANGRLYVGYR